MTKTVDVPSSGPDATPLEVFEVIAARIEAVAKVMDAERKWFGDLVDWSRKVDGGEESIARALADGWIDEEEAEHKRTNDELQIPKANVDKHRHNLTSAVRILDDAGKTIRFLVGNSGEAA